MNSVIYAMIKIFDSSEFISKKIKNILHYQNFVAPELIIAINKTEFIGVIDIIKFNLLGEIFSIRAHKG